MSRINIITAFYNTDLTLFYYSLQSLFNNKDIPYTHIIVNDCSTNIKPDRLEDFVYMWSVGDKSTTKVIHSDKNVGPGGARNLAFKALDNDCEYICFLDSDDRLLPNSLKMRTFALDVARKVNKYIVACYGDKYTRDTRNGINNVTLEKSPEFDRGLLMQQCFIASNSIMFRRDIFEKFIGKLNEHVRLCEDWLCWRQLSFLGNIFHIDVPVYEQIIHGTNLSCQQSVLYNHMRDMIETQGELDDWYQGLKDKHGL